MLLLIVCVMWSAGSKKVSPYVSHLANNPTRIKEIAAVNKVIDIRNVANPYGKKYKLTDDDLNLEVHHDHDESGHAEPAQPVSQIPVLKKKPTKSNDTKLPKIVTPRADQAVTDEDGTKVESARVKLPDVKKKGNVNKSPTASSSTGSSKKNSAAAVVVESSATHVEAKLNLLEKQLVATRQVS